MEKTDLIIGVGSKLAPTIKQAAKDYPKQKFVIVDESYEKIPKNEYSKLAIESWIKELNKYKIQYTASKHKEITPLNWSV